MKLLRSIIAVTLVFAFLNVIAGKAIHEIFEHDHVEHTCENKDINHFHEFEFAHLDFICNFNFSTSFIVNNHVDVTGLMLYFDNHVKVIYNWLADNLYLENLLLRGPPSFK